MPVTTRSSRPTPTPPAAPAVAPALAPAARRSVTSAVQGRTVTDVRRCLEQVRSYWDGGRDSTFSLLSPVCDTTVQDFCFQYVLGHHRKRHGKSAPVATGTPP